MQYITFRSILTIILSLIVVLSSCNPVVNEDKFRIALADTGEVVLTGDDIAIYDAENHSLELNKSGIAKWNSYLIDAANPRSKNILFEKDYVITIEGQEICQGKFWPIYSSYFLPGVFKIYAFDRLDDEFNIIWLGPNDESQNVEVKSALVDYFKKVNRLK